MEPNQDMVRKQGGNDTSATETPNITANATSSTDKSEKKSNKGMIAGMSICIALAAGGIGFGVWAMLDGNVQKDSLNSQISTLKTQNDELTKQNNELSEKNSELSNLVTESEKSNSNTQSESTSTQEKTTETKESSQSEEKAEEGYRVISIGDCIFDASGIYILKCTAETSLGNGKFVWDSERNKLFFATPSGN